VEIAEGVNVTGRRRRQRRSVKVAAAGERALAVAAPAGLPLQADRGVQVCDPVGPLLTRPVIGDEVPLGYAVQLAGATGLSVARRGRCGGAGKLVVRKLTEERVVGSSSRHFHRSRFTKP